MKKAEADIHLETRAEILRVARRCAPCLEMLGPLTFLGDPASEAQRRNWIDSVWLPLLSVSLGNAQALCRRGQSTLTAIDKDLDRHLAGPLAKSSRAAGLLLASSIKAPAGETGFSQYLQSVICGESPGHFAVVFGARAGLFHVPPHLARAAMLFLEMRAASIQDLWPAIEDALAKRSDSQEKFLAA